MTGGVRPKWDRRGEPRTLIRYVPRDVRHFLPQELSARLPAPGSGDRATRARRLFDVIAASGVVYGHEPTSSRTGCQVVREPSEVLAYPGHGTCLDLAVVYAGGCLDAGLHPVILIVDDPVAPAPAHAIVLVRTDRDWAGPGRRDGFLAGLGDHAGPPDRGGLWRSIPSAVTRELRDDVDLPGRVFAVDVSLAAVGAPERPAAEGDLWAAALSHGAAVARAATSVVGVDVGELHDERAALAVLHRPARAPLDPPYNRPEPGLETGPLEEVTARNGLVPMPRS